MESLEALKRIRQETCPATYMPDFDKEECCNVIEKDLKLGQVNDIKVSEINDIIKKWSEGKFCELTAIVKICEVLEYE